MIAVITRRRSRAYRIWRTVRGLPGIVQFGLVLAVLLVGFPAVMVR